MLARQDGRTIHRYGPYAFGEMHIVEIASRGGGHDRCHPSEPAGPLTAKGPSLRSVTDSLRWRSSLGRRCRLARAETPDAALAELLKQARAKLPAACTQPNVDRLIKILCAKTIRIGVRDYYPLFATRKGDKREGYEVDVAQAIGRMLGVDVEFVRVNAATRIPLLAEDRIDLAIATMGHNTQRDGQVRFIRPHYYQSETTVVGPRELPVASMLDLPGRTVCVTVGNGSNAELVSQGARLMLFDEAGVLPDRLKDQTCTLGGAGRQLLRQVLHRRRLQRPLFRRSSASPRCRGAWRWRAQGSAELARALDLISQIFHRDGLFLDIGRLHSIRLGFLRAAAGGLAQARVQHRRRQQPTRTASCRRSTPRCSRPASPPT